MAIPNVVGSGTYSVTDTNEHDLFATTNGEHYTATVDLTNIGSGDTYIFRTYKKTLAGSAQTLLDETSYTYPFTNKTHYVPYVSCPFGFKVTIQKSAGTNRNFAWSVETP